MKLTDAEFKDLQESWVSPGHVAFLVEDYALEELVQFRERQKDLIPSRQNSTRFWRVTMDDLDKAICWIEEKALREVIPAATAPTKPRIRL